MKKRYTRKQIAEAISYWEKQLRKLNESQEDYEAKIREAYAYGKKKGFCNNLVSIETPVDNTVKAVHGDEVVEEYELYIFNYADGTERWVEKKLVNPGWLDGFVRNANVGQTYRESYKINDTVELSIDQLED